jgi:hypothetical protein
MKPILPIWTYIYIIVCIILMPESIAQPAPEKTAPIIRMLSDFKTGSFGVAFFRHDTITVGIESRISVSNGTTADTACKITATNGVIFASVGVLFHDNFSVVEKAREILKMQIETENKIALFDSIIYSKLSLWLVLTDICSIPGIRVDNYTINSMFCTFANQSPITHRRIFIPRCNNGFPYVDTVFESLNVQSIACYPFGRGDGEALIFIKNRFTVDFLVDASPKEIITRIIQHQSLMDNDHIGGDINIVQLTKNGEITWIQKKPSCEQ